LHSYKSSLTNLSNEIKTASKNITSIQYNSLNLPSKVTFKDGSTITYLYAADGTKLRTVHKTGSTATTTDYCGNVVYENGSQKYLLTEEGYVTLADNKYHYYLKDHQGNNRVVISSTGTVEETNHYYPFGEVFAATNNVQPYKYNGKEFDNKNGLNWYDYGARHYDAALGRFISVDPMAEKLYAWSPYVYCLNNPTVYVDKNGEFPFLPNLIGAVLGGAVEYGGQIVGNIMTKGFIPSAFTEIDVADLAVAMSEGFVTSGGSIIRNAMTKTLIGVGTEVLQNAVDVKISSEGMDVSVNDIKEIAGNTAIGLVGAQVKTSKNVSVMQPKSNNQVVKQARQQHHAQGKSLSAAEAKRLQLQNKSRNEMIKEVNKAVSDYSNETVGDVLSSSIKSLIDEEEKEKIK